MASPLVAGIAALLWADNPDLTCDQVTTSITETAKDVNPAVNSHIGETGSAGAIDAAEALRYARENFDKQRKRLSTDEVELSSEEQVYDGGEKRPGIKVTYDGEELSEDSDYLVTYSDNVEAGRALVSVTGIKEYIGTVTKEFDIVPADISGAFVELTPSEFNFDGGYHFPSKITVTVGRNTLKWGKDFTVSSLTDGITKENQKIDIVGKGNYTGVYHAEYKIIGGTPDPDPKEEAKKELAAKIKKAKAKKVSGFKVKALKGKKAKVSWKKVSGVSGYQISRAPGKKVKKKIKAGKYKRIAQITKVKTISFTNKILVKGKKYFYRMRAFTKIKGLDGKVRIYYGKWTAVKSIKAKK
jgi:hypothetical protein